MISRPRTLAVAIGSLLAYASTCTYAVCARWGEDAGLQPSEAVGEQAWPVPFEAISLDESSALHRCPHTGTDLRVTFGVHRGDRLDPLTLREPCGGQVVYAEFSASWAEQRTLVLVLNAAEHPTAQAQVALLTDCGSHLGAVRSDESWVHQHADKLCFGLSVEWLSRSPELGPMEYWEGDLPLR